MKYSVIYLYQYWELQLRVGDGLFAGVMDMLMNFMCK